MAAKALVFRRRSSYSIQAGNFAGGPFIFESMKPTTLALLLMWAPLASSCQTGHDPQATPSAEIGDPMPEPMKLVDTQRDTVGISAPENFVLLLSPAGAEMHHRNRTTRLPDSAGVRNFLERNAEAIHRSKLFLLIRDDTKYNDVVAVYNALAHLDIHNFRHVVTYWPEGK